MFKRKKKEKKESVIKTELNSKIARTVNEAFHVVDMAVVEIIESPDNEINYTLIVNVCAAKASKSRFENVRRFEKLIPGITARPATINEYVDWLIGYLKKGGEITLRYNYPMTTVLEKWFVVEKDFAMRPLHGARSVNLIVPQGVKFLGNKEDLGHSNLYFEDDFSTLNDTFDHIPSYRDILDLIE